MKILTNQKKIFIIVAIVLLVALIAAAVVIIINSVDNRESEPTLEEIISGKLSAYETDLLDSMNSLTSDEAAANYLRSWGENKQISAKTDEYNNVIFTIKASEGYENTAPAVILCSYDSDHMENHIGAIAVALTAAKNAVNHGKYTVIFSPVKDSIEHLSSSLFPDDANVFFLGDADSSKVSSVTGGYNVYRLSSKIKYEAPSYNKAYKISVTNIPAAQAGPKTVGIPNPIKILGNLIANFKSTSLPFELAAFKGGESGELIPSSASVTIVINSSDASKFNSKMESAIKKFNEKYLEKYPDILYTFEEVDLPAKVMSKEKTDNIVSLMYTAFNGVYDKNDDGDVTAFNNIGKIRTAGGKLRIDIFSVSYSQEFLDEMAEAYRTVSGLCNVNFSVRDQYMIFDGGQASQNLIDEFQPAFLSYTGDKDMKTGETVSPTPCTIIKAKNDNMSVVYCGITAKTMEKFAGSLVAFLDKGPLDSEE
ncbi:MAG: hypothetical protein IKW01_00090 [Firmicutes bacterium]|nr:hypothetical protein [Bacillota bacterium]